MLMAITAAITNTSSIAKPDSSGFLTARCFTRSSVHLRFERQRLLVVVFEISVLDRSRIHPDADDLVALLDGVTLGGDHDVLAIQKKRPLIGAGFGLIHEPVK